jgi:hypothetical protein
MIKRNGGGGGGPSMNKNVSVGVRTGKPGKGVSPQAVSRIGMQVVTSTGVAKVPNPKATPLGNQTALQAGCGPGAGRTVRRAGSQQPAPAAGPITTPSGWPWGKQ